MGPTHRRVKEPVQVYLDSRDRALLDELAQRTALPRTELLRLAIRRLAEQMLAETRPGLSMDVLVGVLDTAPDVPNDLAARHDEYLYGIDDGRSKSRR